MLTFDYHLFDLKKILGNFMLSDVKLSFVLQSARAFRIHVMKRLLKKACIVSEKYRYWLFNTMVAMNNLQ